MQHAANSTIRGAISNLNLTSLPQGFAFSLFLFCCTCKITQMKTIAVVLLLVAFACATINWDNYTCAQLQTMTATQAASISCAEWATLPETKYNCFTVEVTCNVIAQCWNAIPGGVQAGLSVRCGAGGTLLSSTTGTGNGGNTRP